MPFPQESLESEYSSQLGSNVVVLDQLIKPGPEAREESVPMSVLTSFEVDLSRPFSDEGEVAQKVNLLVYSRNEMAGGKKDQEVAGLSATVSFTAESCAPVPIVR